MRINLSPREDHISGKSLATEVEEMKMEDAQNSPMVQESRSSSAMSGEQAQSAGAELNASQPKVKRISASPAHQMSVPRSPAVKSDQPEIETIGGDVTVTVRPGKAPKLSRKASQKVVSKPPSIFSHLEDATDEATSTFEILTDCHYDRKNLGSTEHALECDCNEEWDSKAKINHACGEDSDCINRATKMECPGDCGCGAGCQNQRFQQKLYANVSVIKTEKKGYGLRANTDLKPNDFIFEYIGEVITEQSFRKRMVEYDEDGIKHFYFMSLSKSEFVDATKKGNLGRFCNHSCNPNCYVDKWVVGDKLRMGIFAERHIQSGEELVFNYNVDRYGADPQPCYCNEPNCSGFIGGKTQTDNDNSTQLSSSVQWALGIHSNSDWSDATTQKSRRKKKASEDDEEYVDGFELSELDLSSAVPLMGELYKNQEKWVIVKMLQRIQKSSDPRILTRVAALHGYVIMNRVLKQFGDDANLVLQVFDVIHKIPSTTKNKIADAGIEETVSKLVENDDERVRTQAAELLEGWGKLVVAYRIPRRQRDRNAAPTDKRQDRPDRRERDRSRSRSRSRSKSVEAPKAPSGPRNNNLPPRPFHGGPRPPFRARQANGPLPAGWYEATAQNGSTYYYNASGATTWQRPTLAALSAPPPPPPKAVSSQQDLQDLIKKIVSNVKAAPTTSNASAGATPSETPKSEKKEERWRSWPIEKQKKLYENTLNPLVTPVMKSYRGRLDNEELKRFAKDITKKIVDSDYKNDRVRDPSRISSKFKPKVIEHITQFFEKAVIKKKEREKRKAAPLSQQGGSTTPTGSPLAAGGSTSMSKDNDSMEILDNGLQDDNPPMIASDTTLSPTTFKRRHDEQETNGGAEVEDLTNKKPRLEQAQAEALPPPPPPPPPAGDMDVDGQDGHTPVQEAGAEMMAASEQDDGPGFTIKGIAGASSRAGHSPTQVATPPTTGSPDGSERGKVKTDYTGMNPERVRRMESGKR